MKAHVKLRYLLTTIATISTVGGFVWLGCYSYQREHEDPLGQLIERSAMEAALHDAYASGEPDGEPVGEALYMTAQDAANAAEDWNTIFRSCAANPECRHEKKPIKRK